MQKRDLYWDAVKGFGYFCVLIGHIDNTKFIYNFHMPLFFIISGMFFMPGDLKRIVRNLVVPWLYFAVICTLLKTIIGGGLPCFRKLISTSVMGCPYVCSSLWFVSALLVVQLVASWAFPWFDRHRKSKIIFGGYFALLIGLGYIASKHSSWEVRLYFPMMLMSVPMALFFFSIGYYAREHIRNCFSTISRRRSMLWLVLLFPLYMVGSYKFGFSNMFDPVFDNICAFVGLAFIGSICVGLGTRIFVNGRLQQGLAWVGCCSICYFLIEEYSIVISVMLVRPIFPEASAPVYWLPTDLQTLPWKCVVALLTFGISTMAMPFLMRGLKFLKSALPACSRVG